MNPALWRRIEQLYHEALEQAPAERAAWLAACSGDEAVRSEVIRLLAANEEAEGFLAQPLAAVAAAEFSDTATRSKATASLLNQSLGHYRIISHIGAGGMGEVYLAKDTNLGRQAALKLLPAAFTADADRLRRFEREARAASALNHPNILTIYEIGVTDDIHFIATEFVEGITLRQQLADGKPALRTTLEVILQVAAALKAAHRAGIVHRDIKPENVMIRPDGLVKVLDFGLAQVTAQQAERQAGVDSDAPTAALLRTEPGMVMGTPRYMSPEQARGQQTDARTDIFSLGVMLYESVTGRPPFAGASLAEIFANLLHQEPEPLTLHAPQAPGELMTVVTQALRKDREERYQTMQDFADALEQVKRRLEIESEQIATRQLALPTAERFAPTTSPGSDRVQAALKLPTETVSVSPTASVGLPRRRARWLPAALLALGTAILGGGWALYQFGLPTAWFGSPTLSPAQTLASENGTKAYLSLSPNGKQLAYVWNGGKKEPESRADIYIRPVGSSISGDDLFQLTASPVDETSPTWSPDGNQIAFLRDLGKKKWGVYIASVLSKQERKLAEASSGLSWSPDGKTLAISSVTTPEDPGSLFLIPLDGGAPQRLTTASSAPPFNDIHPTFSPDGKQVAFLRQFIDAALDLYVVPVTGGTPKQLTFDKRNIDGLAWTADSREIVYALSRGDGRALWRISATGGTPKRLPLTSQNPYFPTISYQGNRLAYLNQYTDINIYLYERSVGTSLAAPGQYGEARSILPSTREDSSPQFSPDGTRIAFSSQRHDSEAVWVSDREGRNPTQVTDLKRPTGSPRWSPDGQWLTFDSRNQVSADVYIVSANGGTARQITTEPSADTKPSWSRDGQWIYFNSDRSGRGEIWKAPISGGPAKQVTRNGAFEGFESADGKLFYFTKGRGVYGIWAIPPNGGEEYVVPELKQAGYWRSWGVAPEGIYYFNKEPAATALTTKLVSQPTINFFNFATRRVTPLVTVEKEALWWQPGVSISADGRRLLFAQLDHEVYEIHLIENFR